MTAFAADDGAAAGPGASRSGDDRVVITRGQVIPYVTGAAAVEESRAVTDDEAITGTQATNNHAVELQPTRARPCYCRAVGVGPGRLAQEGDAGVGQEAAISEDQLVKR